MVTAMSCTDLPPELWTEIISYLPKRDLRKMIGVNRLLFQLALNEIYEEVRFISDDERMSKVFEQLSNLNIATRVRRLFIRPTFLPSVDEGYSIVPAKFMSLLNKIATKFSVDIFEDKGIFGRAQKALRNCDYLDEVSITLHDQTSTIPLVDFLDSLWTSQSIGPNLRKLTIDTTVAKLPILINSILKHANVLLKLKQVDITLSTSRFPSTWENARGSLVQFFNAFKQSLGSFTFSSLLDCDISSLFASLPHLQNLTEFEFLSVFNAAVIPCPDHLTKFISMHAGTLQRLVIKPYARSATLIKSDFSYTDWVSGTSTDNKSAASFATLVLPHLRILDLGLGDNWNECGTTRQYPLPDFSRNAPSLASLSLSGPKLSNDSVIALLNDLEGSSIESLAFSCYVIFPELFDMLYNGAPCLKSLTVQHLSYVPVLANPSRYKGCAAFASGTYSESRLKYLRLVSQPKPCGAMHPNIALMNNLARALPQGVVLDSRVDSAIFQN